MKLIDLFMDFLTDDEHEQDIDVWAHILTLKDFIADIYCKTNGISKEDFNALYNSVADKWKTQLLEKHKAAVKNPVTDTVETDSN